MSALGTHRWMDLQLHPPVDDGLPVPVQGEVDTTPASSARAATRLAAICWPRPDFASGLVITAADLPYLSAGGLPYANVSPAETLEQAASLIGYDEFRKNEQPRLRTAASSAVRSRF